jgi:hypothetical protein
MGLRCLKANLKEFENDADILEFSLDISVNEIAENIINQNPDFVGFGCYIWNIEQTLRVCEIIQNIMPKTIISLGGPEVSYEYDEFLPYCDYIICGEGELAFYNLIKAIDEKTPPKEKILNEKICDLSQIKMPYYLYNEEDIKNRVIYVEATRGCPFTCEFCLSALSKGVREFDLTLFLENMDMLIKKGVKHFKFIDRTFNIKYDRVKKILGFFKTRWKDGMILHFEVFPDKLNDKMLEEIKNFPKGGLHLEAGVQTFYEPSLKAISRVQNEEKTLKNLEFITNKTGAVIHSDLVAGLPYSTIETFAGDFDKIMRSNPQELQLGILKRLRGAPIDRHTTECKMLYSKHPPYEIMQTKYLSYKELQDIKRFARYFDIFYNSGKFSQTMLLLWETDASKFSAFMDFTNFIWESYSQTHKISIQRQTKILFDYLTQKMSRKRVAESLLKDYINNNRDDRIDYIKEHL